MLDKVHNYIKEHRMIDKGDRIVLGVSGGADSVCLFHVLNQLKVEYQLSLYVVHVNHGIRKEEAGRDEEYVRTLCLENHIPMECVKVDVKEMSKSLGLSEEEAGRNVRYKAFYDCFDKYQCNKIAIAHNKNDSAETILFHMFRGSGLKGLSGIRPYRDEIIRPLLGIERYEIEHYLYDRKIEYCNDYTNDTDDYSRNRIRHHVLGYAREHINSQAVEHIVKAGEQISEVQRYIDGKIKEAFDLLVEYNDQNIYKFNISMFIKEDIIIQRGIIREILYRLGDSLKDMEYIHVEYVLSLLDKQVGKYINLPARIIARRDYDMVVLLKSSDDYKENWDLMHFDIKNISEKSDNDLITPYSLPVEVSTYLSMNSDSAFCMALPSSNQTLTMRLLKYDKNMIIPQNGYTKWFDYDRIKNTVLIRTRAQGDYFSMDDKGNKKKLKSYFIDQKIPKEERDSKLLIADGAHILWVVGARNSEGYKIHEETKVILEISLNGGK